MNRAPLTLLVGPETGDRDAIAQRLVERGWSVFACSSAPGCPLLRETRCALVEVADITVFMPASAARRDIATQLTLCARTAIAPVVVEPSITDLRRTMRAAARSVDPDDVLDAIDEAIREPKDFFEGRKKVTADVADIWL